MYQSYVWPGATQVRGQKNIFIKWMKAKLDFLFKKVDSVERSTMKSPVD